MDFLRSFCRFAVTAGFEDLSETDLAVARSAFVDGTGVMLAGAGEEVSRIVRTWLEEGGGRGPARVAGSRIRTRPSLAALANGVSGHSLDYDDVNHPMMAHPTTVLLPVVYAAEADRRTVTGREALLAYALGLELGARLGRRINPAHYERGWHATSTLGTLAAAVVAGRLRGLDAVRLEAALGVAASMASGLRRNFGSMTKPFHAGHAARCGLEAAGLAATGLTSSPGILDGPMGFRDLVGEGVDGRRGGERWGRPFELTASGLAVKRYPCCAGSHSALDAVLELRGRAALPLKDLREVVVRVDPLVPRMMIHDRPRNGLEGKFSLRYCVAAALTDGRVDLATFSEGAVRSKRILRWMSRIVIQPDLDGGTSEGGIPKRSLVTFRWRDGTTDSCAVEIPSGNPERPLGPEILEAKFQECASRVLPPGRVKRLWRLLSRLEDLEGLQALTRCLAGTG